MQETAVEFGVPHHYTDYRKMLEHHALDIISLALPPAANRETAINAFEAGANVLVSKPLATNITEAEEMIAVAKRCGKLMSMGLQNRSNPEVQALRQFLADGKLGNVYHTRLWQWTCDAHPRHPHHVQTSPSRRWRAFPYNRSSSRRNPLGIG